MSLDNMGLLVTRSLFPVPYNQSVKNQKDQGEKYLSQRLVCKQKIKMQRHTQQKPLGMTSLCKSTSLLFWWYSNYMVIWDIMILDTPPHWPHTFIVYFLAMLVLPECIEKQRGHFDAG